MVTVWVSNQLSFLFSQAQIGPARDGESGPVIGDVESFGSKSHLLELP